MIRIVVLFFLFLTSPTVFANVSDVGLAHFISDQNLKTLYSVLDVSPLERVKIENSLQLKIIPLEDNKISKLSFHAIYDRTTKTIHLSSETPKTKNSIIFFHEYVHHILAVKKVKLPLWLEEGFAQTLTYEILRPEQIPRLQQYLKSAPGIVFQNWRTYNGLNTVQMHALYAQSYAFVSWLSQRLSLEVIAKILIKAQPQTLEKLEYVFTKNGFKITHNLLTDFALALQWNNPQLHNWFVTPYYTSIAFSPDENLLTSLFPQSTFKITELTTPDVPFYTARHYSKALCGKRSNPGMTTEADVQSGTWNGKSAARALCPASSDFAVIW